MRDRNHKYEVIIFVPSFPEKRAGESKNRVQATYTSVQISGIHVVTARELGQMVQKQLLDT